MIQQLRMAALVGCAAALAGCAATTRDDTPASESALAAELPLCGGDTPGPRRDEIERAIRVAVADLLESEVKPAALRHVIDLYASQGIALQSEDVELVASPTELRVEPGGPGTYGFVVRVQLPRIVVRAPDGSVRSFVTRHWQHSVWSDLSYAVSWGTHAKAQYDAFGEVTGYVCDYSVRRERNLGYNYVNEAAGSGAPTVLSLELARETFSILLPPVGG